jgi:hypothetical protein
MFDELSTGVKWLIGIAGGLSVLLFVGTLVCIPILIVRLRPDYFTNPRRIPGPWRRQHPVAAGLLFGLKNVLGALLVLTGLLMLLTPGQGVLTILIGLTMMNYPGKYRAEKWIITRKPIWRTVAWLRKKAHAPPLQHPTGEKG